MFARTIGAAYSAGDADVSLEKTVFSVGNQPLILAITDTSTLTHDGIEGLLVEYLCLL